MNTVESNNVLINVKLEEMDPEELHAPNYSHTRVRNVYFEITPVNLLSGWVNEEGIVEFNIEEESEPAVEELQEA